MQSRPSCATDAAIERLQTRVATKAQEAREQAEAEVAALKQVRNRGAEGLTALRASSNDAWRTHRIVSERRSTISSEESAKRH